MSELIKERIDENFLYLKLNRMRDIYSDIITTATEQDSSYMTMLDQLLSEEVSSKHDRRIKTSLKTSGIPVARTIEEYDFSFHPDLDKRSVMNLFDLSFIEKKENVFFLGPPGVGKTHLAVALAIKALHFGSTIYFTTMTQLMNKLKKDAADEKPYKGRSHLKSQLLIIDEVGYMPMNRQESHLFFQFVCYRYGKNSTVITSNKSFSEWEGLVDDPVIATAILDRLLHHCHVVSIKGNSYRLKEFNQRKKSST